MRTPGDPRRPGYLAEKWLSLRAGLRVPVVLESFLEGLLTEEERAEVFPEVCESRDIAAVWARLRGISMVRATVDLGVEMHLLTDIDRQRLLRQAGEPSVQLSTPRPAWNRATGELCLGSELIKRVRRLKVASNVIRVLEAFQEEGWPRHIDDPLPPRRGMQQTPQQRLHETVKSLNSGLSTIRFRADGSGRGVVWAYRGISPPSPRTGH
jgi:hypothetical protein